MSGNAKRRLPFKPPGPAGRASRPPARTTPRVSKSANRGMKGKGPAQLVPPSSSEEDEPQIAFNEEDDEDFGTTIDLEAADLAGLEDLSTGLRRPGQTLHTEAQNQDQHVDKSNVLKLAPELLTRLVYENLKDKDIKIGQAANEAFQTYVDMFVREAVARARLEKLELLGEAAKIAGQNDVWLDNDDLERVAPGLLLDF